MVVAHTTLLGRLRSPESSGLVARGERLTERFYSEMTSGTGWGAPGGARRVGASGGGVPCWRWRLRDPQGALAAARTSPREMLPLGRDATQPVGERPVLIAAATPGLVRWPTEAAGSENQARRRFPRLVAPWLLAACSRSRLYRPGSEDFRYAMT